MTELGREGGRERKHKLKRDKKPLFVVQVSEFMRGVGLEALLLDCTGVCRHSYDALWWRREALPVG